MDHPGHDVGITAPRGRCIHTGALVPPRFCGAAARRTVRPCPLSSAPAPHAQVGLFLLAYLVYSAARFVAVGDLATRAGPRELDRRPRAGPRRRQRGVGPGGAERDLDHLAAQPRLPRGAAARRARRADLPLPPLAPDLRAAAQHDPRHLADLDPDLRGVPRRSPAARRHRHGRHDHRADRLRDGLGPDDQVLQRARRRAEPARRLRRRRRDRARRRRCATRSPARPRCCGAP